MKDWGFQCLQQQFEQCKILGLKAASSFFPPLKHFIELDLKILMLAKTTLQVFATT